MTGPDRPVRQPANTRASVLPGCFLRLAAFPCVPETRTFISARGGADRERRTPCARPMRTIPSSTSRVVSSCCGTIRWAIVRAVGSAYTAALGNWAPASRPVRPPGGVYTGRRHDVVRKEGAQDGDSRSALTGACRGRRGVPGAGRVAPAGAAGALLPDARLLRRRRGRRPGDDAGRLAGHRRVRRGPRVAAHLAVQDRHQPVPERAPRGAPPPGQGVGRVAVRTARADAARGGRLAAAVP